MGRFSSYKIFFLASVELVTILFHVEFQALDFVVSEARKYRIRLILSLVNNWDAYGGKPQYVKWGKAAGLNLTSDDDFFSHPTLKSYYKAHVKASSYNCLRLTRLRLVIAVGSLS